LIMTSNIKVNESNLSASKESDGRVRGELAEILRPEFVNRIGDIVQFSPLAKSHFELLVDKELAKLNLRIYDRGIQISLGSKLRQMLLESSLDGKFGGRALKRSFQSLVIDPVSERIIDLVDEADEGVWLLEMADTGIISWTKLKEIIELPPAALA
jgi:ATP-dependent Clp protease ATP-binding subunit ClpA